MATIHNVCVAKERKIFSNIIYLCCYKSSRLLPHLISVGALPIRLFYWALQLFRPALFRLFQFVS